MRTIGDTKKNTKEFDERNEKTIKDFHSAAHQFRADDHNLTLSHVALPELRQILLATNKLTRELEMKNEESFNDCTQRLSCIMEFTGNMCRRLLNNVHALREMIQEFPRVITSSFTDASQTPNEACFGKDFSKSLRSKVLHFKKSYLQWNISLIITVCVIFNHLQFRMYFSYNSFTSQQWEISSQQAWKVSMQILLPCGNHMEKLILRKQWTQRPYTYTYMSACLYMCYKYK